MMLVADKVTILSATNLGYPEVIVPAALSMPASAEFTSGPPATPIARAAANSQTRKRFLRVVFTVELVMGLSLKVGKTAEEHVLDPIGTQRVFNCLCFE